MEPSKTFSAELTIFAYNVGSLLNDQRRKLLSNFMLSNYHQVMCISETWLITNIEDGELFLPQYFIVRSDRPSNNDTSLHGGAMLCIHNSLAPIQLYLPDKYLGYCAAALLPCLNKTIVIASLYNPPIDSQYRLPIDDLTELIKLLHSNSSYVILVGDLNLPSINWNTLTSPDESENTLLQLFDDLNIKQHISFLTTSSNTLDLVLASNKINLVNAAPTTTNNLPTSVHLPISCTLTIEDELKLRQFTAETYLSYCKTDYAMLNNFIEQDPFYSICWSNVSVVVNNWYDWLRPKIRACTPRRTKHRQTLPPWVSPEASNLLKKMTTISSKYCKWHIKYIQVSNELCAALDRDKSDYESTIAEKRNTKLLFKYYKSFNKTTYPAVMHHGNIKVESDIDKANLFADYFSSVFFESSSFECGNLGLNCAFPILEELSINENLVLELCKTIDINKSRGPDDLPAIILKNCAHSLSHSLCQIFKKICQTSTYPESWKQSLVVPIHKKGSKQDVSNYRPVSLIDLASKIFEYCLFLALYNHLYPFFDDAQYGFRKRRSCVLQLLKHLDLIYKAIEQNKPVDVIYTDFEKAFDKVDHDILLRKLHFHGIRGKLLTLIQSYLRNRPQRVKINNSLSYCFLASSGVPQGAIPAALFYLIFINDMPKVCLSSEALLNADDAKFLNFTVDIGPFQNDLNNVFSWTVYNRASFNTDKCYYMSFGRTISPQLCFNDKVIKRRDLHEDLGLIISSNLSWKPHIENVITKANKVLSMLKRNSPNIPAYTKLNLYKSMVLPILTYASPCVELNVECMGMLESVQKRLFRWICRDLNYRQALITFNVLPLPYYFQLLDLITFSKALNNYYDADLTEHFSQNFQNYSTRSVTSNMFQCQRPWNKKSEQNFWFRAARLANLCPPSVDIRCIVGLKHRLLKWLWDIFNRSYQEHLTCTWRAHCDCRRNDCRNIIRS